MNNSRKYAEDLVGALKTEHYNTQRDVASQVNKTNWEKLANEYKNLQENLEMKRQANNRAFAKGLVNVAESSYDQSRAGAQNLAQRGLNVSGMQNLVQQADTAAKGERVLGLLNNLGENVTANMEKLSDATSKVAQKEAQLGADLADTLGDIGAAQTNAQMNYNAGLAEIAGSKDARDMENEMARLQREAQAAANARSRSGSDGVDEEAEDFYKKQSIAAILGGVDPRTGEEIEWDDAQKANALQILLGVSNAKALVDAYNNNSTLTSTNKTLRDENKQDLKDTKKSLEKKTKQMIENAFGRKLNIATSDEDRESINKEYEIMKQLEKDNFAGFYDALVNDKAYSVAGDDEFMLNLKDATKGKDWQDLINTYNKYVDLQGGPKYNTYKDLQALFYE